MKKRGVLVVSDRWKQLITQWDGINQQLLDLMNERARMAAEIVQEKNKQGISQAEPVGNQQLLNELATLTFASEIKKRLQPSASFLLAAGIRARIRLFKSSMPKSAVLRLSSSLDPAQLKAEINC
ncbi:chorismate mutase type II [Paenibacillus alvei DSM 29]|nr:chorismate mutase type II [Paenibacillus alvei DSM 29]